MLRSHLLYKIKEKRNIRRKFKKKIYQGSNEDRRFFSLNTGNGHDEGQIVELLFFIQQKSLFSV